MDMAVLITVRGWWDCLLEICCSRHNALNVGIDQSNICQLSTCSLGGNLLEFECFCHFNLIVLDKPAQEEEKQQKVNNRPNGPIAHHFSLYLLVYSKSTFQHSQSSRKAHLAAWSWVLDSFSSSRNGRVYRKSPPSSASCQKVLQA